MRRGVSERETKKGRIKNCSESHLGRIIRYLSVAYQVSLLKRITPFDVNARPLVCAATINAVDVLQQILISRSSSWLPEAITHYVCTPTITLLSLLSNGTSTEFLSWQRFVNSDHCFDSSTSFVHIGRDGQLWMVKSIFKINIKNVWNANC